jgi:hypothetical protein
MKPGYIEVVCEECGNTTVRKESSQKACIEKYGKNLCPECILNISSMKRILYYNDPKDLKHFKCEHCGHNYIRPDEIENIKFDRYKKHLCLKCFMNVSRQDFWDNRCDKAAFKETMKKATYFHEYNQSVRGMSLEDRVGEEKAASIKAKAKQFFIDHNPQRGKPAPKGGGGGWSGHYDGWYFRSLKELSYKINVIEAKGLKYENAEKAKYAIPYGENRTHFADFVIGDTIVEIKPVRSACFKTNVEKREAGEKWAAAHNMKYVMVTDDQYPQLTTEQIADLIVSGKLVFIERYRLKFEEKYGHLLHNRHSASTNNRISS